MTVVSEPVEIIEHERVSTWFEIGGAADRLCRPGSADGVVASVLRAGESGWPVRVLGDGANLLVMDDGIDGLVIDSSGLGGVEMDRASGVVRAEAGVKLFDLINATVRAGLGGLEVLAGIPARMGGAAMMNAGGKFGSIAEAVRAVEGVGITTGERVRLEREQIGFGYRRSGLAGLVLTSVELGLEPGDSQALRARRNECMAYKKASQPMRAKSAGCCFKNPTLVSDLDGIGQAGARISAGMLIDRAGCKGVRTGGATVSEEHANFLVTEPGATAGDVVALMNLVAGRVHDAFGVTLDREVVVWERGP